MTSVVPGVCQDATTSSRGGVQPRPEEVERKEGEQGQRGKQQVQTVTIRACEDMLSGVLCVKRFATRFTIC